MPSTTNSDIFVSEDYSKDKVRSRIDFGNALGGLRALDIYTEERFVETTGNSEAFREAKSFDPSKDNIFIQGPTGSGKSHLAAIAIRRFLKYPLRVSTITQMLLSREVRRCDSARGEQEVIDRYVNTKVLLIDDLGVAKDTEFSLSLLYEIINGRYMNRPGGLVITSNLGLGNLAEKIGDDRISSRLAQMCKFFNLASEKDRRLPQ